MISEFLCYLFLGGLIGYMVGWALGFSDGRKSILAPKSDSKWMNKK